MNGMKWMGVLAIALILCWACGTEAAEGGRGKRKPGDRMKKLLERFDKDGDGKLNEEERAAALEGFMNRVDDFQGKHKKKLLEKYDKDGDGKLSEKEKEAMKEAMKKHYDEFQEKHKKDGEGKGHEEKKDGKPAQGEAGDKNKNDNDD